MTSERRHLRIAENLAAGVAGVPTLWCHWHAGTSARKRRGVLATPQDRGQVILAGWRSALAEPGGEARHQAHHGSRMPNAEVLEAVWTGSNATPLCWRIHDREGERGAAVGPRFAASCEPKLHGTRPPSHAAPGQHQFGPGYPGGDLRSEGVLPRPPTGALRALQRACALQPEETGHARVLR